MYKLILVISKLFKRIIFNYYLCWSSEDIILFKSSNQLSTKFICVEEVLESGLIIKNLPS